MRSGVFSPRPSWLMTDEAWGEGQSSAGHPVLAPAGARCGN